MEHQNPQGVGLGPLKGRLHQFLIGFRYVLIVAEAYDVDPIIAVDEVLLVEDVEVFCEGMPYIVEGV